MNNPFKAINKRIKHENEIIDKNREAITRVNYAMTKLVCLCFTIVLTVGFFSSLLFNTFVTAGFGELLQWGYFVTICVALVTYLILAINQDISFEFSVYSVNFLAFLYSILVGCYLAPSNVTVTMLIVLFQFAVLYIDYPVRINLLAMLASAAYLGVAYFTKEPGAFYAEAVNLLTVLAIVVFVGTITRFFQLENISLKEDMKRQAYTDQLTKLYNRRKLFEDLAYSENAENEKKITGLALCDIDYFKNYNDHYGHGMGDSCLVKISAQLLKIKKQYNITIYRYGGEEFLIAFWDSDDATMRQNIVQITASIEKLGIEHSQSEHKVVTFSAGLCTEDVSGHRYQLALSHADTALYDAKKSGRNRVVFYDESIKAEKTVNESFRSNKR